MSRVCSFCQKSTIYGNTVPRKGKSKKQGGNGEHIVRRTARAFKANIFRVRSVENGVTKVVKVCSRCLKAGKVHKA